MKKMLVFLLLLLPSVAFAVSYDSGGGAAGADQGDVLSGGTANAVVYTNGSTGLTTGSFGFNGTTGTLTALGIRKTTPSHALDIVGVVQASSMTIISGYFTAGQTVTSASTSTLTWTEVLDRQNEFVTSSFTVVLAGNYEILAQVNASQTAGTGCILVKKNSVSFPDGQSCATGATALATVLNPSVMIVETLAVGDIIRFDASATSANVTFQSANFVIKRLP